MKKEFRVVGTDYYEYVNVNPKGKHCGDCVIRAVAHATDQSWADVMRDLTELGIKKGYVAIDKNIYPKYLEAKGFIQMPEPRDVNNRKMTIMDWINQEQIHKGTYVINAGSHHVTVVKDGKVNDIWNCSGSTMHKYWYKSR